MRRPSTILIRGPIPMSTPSCILHWPADARPADVSRRDDPDAWGESSGTGMFASCMAYGIRLCWLEGAYA